MSVSPKYPVERGEPVNADEIEELRLAVGWDRAERTFDAVLAGSYCHYTVRDEGRLIGFLNVISDGVSNAFLVNITVHPAYQKRGIGRVLVSRVVDDLTADGIQSIEVTFAPENEGFYRKCGFHPFGAGIIDNADPARRRQGA